MTCNCDRLTCERRAASSRAVLSATSGTGSVAIVVEEERLTEWLEEMLRLNDRIAVNAIAKIIFCKRLALDSAETGLVGE